MADNRVALHQGQATERNTKSASARVGFDDLAGTVSSFLQVLFPAAGGWNFFYTPKEGDQVIVNRLPNGKEEGYILGKVYTAGKMPQGGADNIILIVSDDGKNLVKFDADKGTLDLIVEQNGTLKFKNLEINIEKTTHLTTNDLDIEVKKNTHLATNDLDIEAKNSTHLKTDSLDIETGKNTHLTTNDLDIEVEKPIGFSGAKTQLGADVLQMFFNELKTAMLRNPVVIPPVPWPKGTSVPPVPPIVNMFLNGLIADIVAAIEKAKVACAKALK
jgi:phage baseplate assembly protein gpV